MNSGLGPGNTDLKDTDDTSTDNGSSNGDHGGVGGGPGSGGVDPSTMLAAREKSLISHAMDTLTRRVAENGNNVAGDSTSEGSDEEMTDIGKRNF